MNAAAANILAETFLSGAFGVFDAMLSKNYQHAPGTAAIADEAALRGHLAECPVQMVAVIQQGLGQAALLFSNADALGFLAALSGTPLAEEITPADKDTLREVAESALGGGVAQLMEKFGKGVVQLETVKVDISGNVGSLASAMGGKAISVPFTFDSGDGEGGSAYVLFSAGMDGLVPPAMLAPASPPELAQASLSPDELNDILGGFPASDMAPAPSAPLGSGGDRRGPSLLHGTENLDLVLDIRLLATARLGRVEMPLGDILSLGPGSILEVGHLVDEPIELLINDKLIARGDVVVVDEKFGLRITEIVSQRERIESLR